MSTPARNHLLTDEEKEKVLVEVVQRVLNECCQDPQQIERVLFDTLYEERRRLESDRNKARARLQSAFYDDLYHQALRASSERQRDLLKAIVQFFAEEVAGHFDPRVYALSTRIVPTGLSILLNAMSPIRLLQAIPSGFKKLDDRLLISGDLDAVRKMAKLGTVVLLPTHCSNLDSILVGFALYRLGLPPFLYGAGLNLFDHRLIGFFMHNLGAYKVDRKKKARLYKNVLKTYAGCTMELGYHNLFFPGGTRSRSGAVEQKLKLGLLGQALNSYIRNLIAHKPAPDIYVVPCTINYQLVLEAETLIDDHLKEAGKSRYVIDDDEFTKTRRILEFTSKLFSLDSRIHLVFAPPMDVFGNRVDGEGRSLDHRGRPIERTRYVLIDDKPDFDPQRDMEYTRELARAVVDSFLQHTVVNSTHVVSQLVFRWLKQRAPEMDLYRLLRTGGPEESLPLTEAYQLAERLLDRLRALASQGRLRLDDTIQSGDAHHVVTEALAHLGSYHRRPGVVRKGDRLFHADRNLLLYYQNRLAGYPVDQEC
ncbi:MAG: 1-acyl-sn-glycerol-3-phosphate acyltransferase [Bradymonadales bacterium]|nr:1-acyl-sn-glycerol-3-phosphate acyltransferase [Bradymonadales bacterium]